MSRVLVVDDDVSVRLCITEFLRKEGYDVTEASNGFGALVIATEQGRKIGMVVTDVQMPGMDGIEMWRRMKPLVAPDCKVVFISGMAETYLNEGWKFPG